MSKNEIDFMLLNLSKDEAIKFFTNMMLLAKYRYAKGVNKDKNKILFGVYMNVLSKIENE